MNKIKSFYKDHPFVSCVGSLILAASIGAKVAHKLPLSGLSDSGYASYQIENGFDVPELLRDYLEINPYNTDILQFGDDTVFIRDNTQKRLYALTCPRALGDKNGKYCLLRDNPYTINFGKLVFGNGVPISDSIAKQPFDILEKRHSRDLVPSMGI